MLTLLSLETKTHIDPCNHVTHLYRIHQIVIYTTNTLHTITHKNTIVWMMETLVVLILFICKNHSILSNTLGFILKISSIINYILYSTFPICPLNFGGRTCVGHTHASPKTTVLLLKITENSNNFLKNHI